MEFCRQEYWSGLPFSSSRGFSRPRDQTCVSCISFIGRQILYHECHLGRAFKRDPQTIAQISGSYFLLPQLEGPTGDGKLRAGRVEEWRVVGSGCCARDQAGGACPLLPWLVGCLAGGGGWVQGQDGALLGSVLVWGSFGGLGDLANITVWAQSIQREWSPCGDDSGPVVSTELGQSILEWTIHSPCMLEWPWHPDDHSESSNPWHL